MPRALAPCAAVLLALAGCAQASPDRRPAAARTAAAATVAQASPEPRPAAAATTVWALGDADTTPLGRSLAKSVRRARPDLLLYLGDVYDSGTAGEFRLRYDPLFGTLARRTLPTPGNHEWPRREVGYRPYWRAAHGRPIPDWQKRRIGGWEILALNSEAPHGDGSAQLEWLRRTTSKPGSCRIAIFHRPRFSTGWHGDQEDMAPLWDALRGRARLVLSGHDHDMQRFADRDGLRQLVAGAGGSPNVPLASSSQARLRFAERLRPGALRLGLSPGHASIDFVASNGRVLDRSTATCRRQG